MQCKDKFLVQSVIVAEDTSAKDITGDMVLHILNFLQNIPVGCSFLQCLWLYLVQFTKKSGNVVDEVKLRVVYVPPPKPPSPVREGSEEGSSPRHSLSDGSDLNYQEVRSANITAWFNSQERDLQLLLLGSFPCSPLNDFPVIGFPLDADNKGIR